MDSDSVPSSSSNANAAAKNKPFVWGTLHAQDLLVCTLCSEYFKDPRVLRCDHTFCRRCLQEHYDQRQASYGTKIATMPCPTCQDRTHLPIIGVPGLPVDSRHRRAKEIFVSELLEDVRRRSSTDPEESEDTVTEISDTTKLDTQPRDICPSSPKVEPQQPTSVKLETQRPTLSAECISSNLQDVPPHSQPQDIPVAPPRRKRQSQGSVQTEIAESNSLTHSEHLPSAGTFRSKSPPRSQYTGDPDSPPQQASPGSRSPPSWNFDPMDNHRFHPDLSSSMPRSYTDPDLTFSDPKSKKEKEPNWNNKTPKSHASFFEPRDKDFSFSGSRLKRSNSDRLRSKRTQELEEDLKQGNPTPFENSRATRFRRSKRNLKFKEVVTEEAESPTSSRRSLHNGHARPKSPVFSSSSYQTESPSFSSAEFTSGRSSAHSTHLNDDKPDLGPRLRRNTARSSSFTSRFERRRAETPTFDPPRYNSDRTETPTFSSSDGANRPETPLFGSPSSTHRSETPTFEPRFQRDRAETPTFESRFQKERAETPTYESRFQKERAETPTYESRFKKDRAETPTFESRFKQERAETPTYESRFKRERAETPTFGSDQDIHMSDTPKFESRFGRSRRSETPTFDSKFGQNWTNSPRPETPSFASERSAMETEPTSMHASHEKIQTTSGQTHRDIDVEDSKSEFQTETPVYRRPRRSKEGQDNNNNGIFSSRQASSSRKREEHQQKRWSYPAFTHTNSPLFEKYLRDSDDEDEEADENVDNAPQIVDNDSEAGSLKDETNQTTGATTTTTISDNASQNLGALSPDGEHTVSFNDVKQSSHLTSAGEQLKDTDEPDSFKTETFTNGAGSNLDLIEESASEDQEVILEEREVEVKLEGVYNVHAEVTVDDQAELGAEVNGVKCEVEQDSDEEVKEESKEQEDEEEEEEDSPEPVYQPAEQQWLVEKSEHEQPTSLALMPSGKVVVADYGHNNLQFYSEEGELEFQVEGLKPYSMAVNKDGNLFVGDRKNKTLKVFDEFGTDVAQWPENILDWVSGIGALSDGTIVVLDRQYCRVKLFSADGENKSEFGSYGVRDRQLAMADFLAVDSNDRIIVCDSGNHCVKVFDRNGTVLLKFGSRGTKRGQLQWPKGVCVDDKDNIIVADTKNNRVCMFNPQGEYIQRLVKDVPNPFAVSFTRPNQLGVTQFSLSGESDFRIYKLDEVLGDLTLEENL